MRGGGGAVVSEDSSPLTPESCSGFPAGSESYHLPPICAHTVSLTAPGKWNQHRTRIPSWALDLSQLCPSWPVSRQRCPQNSAHRLAAGLFLRTETMFQVSFPEVVEHPLFTHLVTLPFSPHWSRKKQNQRSAKPGGADCTNMSLYRRQKSNL